MDLIEVGSVRVARTRDDLALGPGEHLLAGGTWLYSEPQRGVTGLVDLTGLGWDPVESLPGGGLRLAATCPIARLHELPAPPSAAALARECADALLMSWKIQAVATVGGNVCMALPAGAMTAFATALDGEAVIWRPDGGERREPVADLVRGPRTTTLRRGEVLRAIDLTGAALGARFAVRQLSLAPRGRSAALLVGRRDADGAVALTITGSTPRPRVLRFASPPEPDALAEAVADAGPWYDDVHGAPDWRAAMTARLAEQLRAELAGESGTTAGPSGAGDVPDAPGSSGADS
ncbi:MAG: FAD binding domain-containing protein [Actinomycetales bacterium]|nr:FAD binding domain-containing protein [Actinomycetales bacterium]